MASIFTTTPAVVTGDDGTAYTLGTAFYSTQNASCTGARWFFPSTLPTGTVTMSLWTREPGVEGTKLEEKAFVAPVANSWNSVTWDTPVNLTANIMYEVTAHTPNRYVYTLDMFDSAGVTNGILTAIQDNVLAPSGGGTIRNGELAVGASPTFPNSNAGGACYFADPIVTTGVTVNVGTATETDTALPIGRTHRRTVGTVTEADSALPIGKRHQKAVSTVVETDAALPITRIKRRAIGIATSTEVALPITRQRRFAIGVATEISSALALVRRKIRLLGTATEVDAALPIAGGAQPDPGPPDVTVKADPAVTVLTKIHTVAVRTRV